MGACDQPIKHVHSENCLFLTRWLIHGTTIRSTVFDCVFTYPWISQGAQRVQSKENGGIGGR